MSWRQHNSRQAAPCLVAGIYLYRRSVAHWIMSCWYWKRVFRNHATALLSLIIFYLNTCAPVCCALSTYTYTTLMIIDDAWPSLIPIIALAMAHSLLIAYSHFGWLETKNHSWSCFVCLLRGGSLTSNSRLIQYLLCPDPTFPFSLLHTHDWWVSSTLDRSSSASVTCSSNQNQNP